MRRDSRLTAWTGGFFTVIVPSNKSALSQCLAALFRLTWRCIKKLRKAAADLGADAVIVSGQSQGFSAVPGVQSTVVVGSTAITTGGSYAGSYPKNQGIAIRYDR